MLFYVEDNGLGVPRADRDRLFERFFRAGAEATAVEGTGLGLSIIRETLQSVGGRAWADFPESGGSVFGIALRRHRGELTHRHRRGPGDERRRPGGGQHRTPRRRRGHTHQQRSGGEQTIVGAEHCDLVADQLLTVVVVDAAEEDAVGLEVDEAFEQRVGHRVSAA